MKERKYFDSGDFALSAAGRETDNGAIKTGVDYPRRESISRPHAPVPKSSNVNDDANEKPHDQTRGDAEMVDTPLHQHTESNEKTKRIYESTT
jgi:hypothetical protein